MENKTECEIVQDLLLGYVDDVLNTESKKLVEKHLLKCDNYQTKHKEIKADIEESENNQNVNSNNGERIETLSELFKKYLIPLAIQVRYAFARILER